MNSPFKFLDAYTAKDKDVFFGREKEIEELYKKVLMTSLVLVYGMSGTGKTSIVRCGLAKRFRGPDWYPLYIRRGEDLNLALQQTMAQKAGSTLKGDEGDKLNKIYEGIRKEKEGKEQATKVLPENSPGEEGQVRKTEQEKRSEQLAGYINQLYANYMRPVYLVFDQFEEIFTIGKEEEQQVFANNLRDLISADLPCKIILVMREEYIGYLYYYEKVLPSINDFRIRIEAMDDNRVAEVIRKSCPSTNPPFNVTLEDEKETPDLIISKIRGREAEATGPRSRIQLPYLQVYLDGLYRHVLEKEYPEVAKLDELPAPLPRLTFTNEAIEEYGSIENVLGAFLDKQMIIIQEDLKNEYPNTPKEAVKEVLDRFVTADGTKVPRSPDDIKVANLKPAARDMIIKDLLDARILRPEGSRYELAHDALASYINEHRSDEEKRFKEIIEFLKTKYIQYQKDLTGKLSAHEVALVLSHPRPSEVKAELTRSEWQYFKTSENKVLRRRFFRYFIAAGVLVVILFLSLGGNALQYRTISQKNKKIDEQKKTLIKENEFAKELAPDSALKEKITEIGGIIEDDEYQRARDSLDALIVSVGGDPDTPAPDDSEGSTCAAIIENTRTALRNDSEDPCNSKVVFDEFWELVNEGASCSDNSQQRVLQSLQEEVNEKCFGLISEGDGLRDSKDYDHALEYYEKAKCLCSPTRNSTIDESIRFASDKLQNQ